MSGGEKREEYLNFPLVMNEYLEHPWAVAHYCSDDFTINVIPKRFNSGSCILFVIIDGWRLAHGRQNSTCGMRMYICVDLVQM